jgi:hypothetical protein
LLVVNHEISLKVQTLSGSGVCFNIFSENLFIISANSKLVNVSNKFAFSIVDSKIIHFSYARRYESTNSAGYSFWLLLGLSLVSGSYVFLKQRIGYASARESLNLFVETKYLSTNNALPNSACFRFDDL